MDTEMEKIMALVRSSDISSVLLAFELNTNLALDSPLSSLDQRMQKFKNKTLIVEINKNRICIQDSSEEIDEKEADDMRQLLMELNPRFYQFPFMEEFLSKRYQTKIVFTF